MDRLTITVAVTGVARSAGQVGGGVRLGWMKGLHAMAGGARQRQVCPAGTRRAPLRGWRSPTPRQASDAVDLLGVGSRTLFGAAHPCGCADLHAGVSRGRLLHTQ